MYCWFCGFPITSLLPDTGNRTVAFNTCVTCGTRYTVHLLQKTSMTAVELEKVRNQFFPDLQEPK